MGGYEFKYLKRERIGEIPHSANGEFLYFIATPQLEDSKVKELEKRIEMDISNNSTLKKSYEGLYKVSFSGYEETDDGTILVLKIESPNAYEINEADKEPVIKRACEEFIEGFNIHSRWL